MINLSDTEITAIYTELDSGYPMCSNTCVFTKGLLCAREYANLANNLYFDDFIGTNATFLLLVLAADGVPYDC